MTPLSLSSADPSLTSCIFRFEAVALCVWRTHTLAAWAPLLGVGAASDSSASCRGLRELDIGFNNSVPSDVLAAMRACCPLFCSQSASPPFD